MNDFEDLWASLEVRLTAVLGRLPDSVDARVKQEARCFVSHREYGAALEGLSAYLREENIAVDAETQSLLESLNRDMADDD